MTFQELIQQIQTLSPEELTTLAEIVQSLQQAEAEKRPIVKRTLGLGQEMGHFSMSPDFNDPLLSEDWMDNLDDPLN